MIHNDAQLKVVEKQLSRARLALASLRREVLPKNKRNFEIVSEAYIDQIAELRAEINAYKSSVKKNGAVTASDKPSGGRKAS